MRMVENKKNMWFYIIFAVLMLGSVTATFLKYYVYKDYQIEAQVSCDINTEKCFQTACDNTVESSCATTTDGTSVSYYKKISKNASSVMTCENSKEKTGCTGELSCTSGEKDCAVMYCSTSTLGDGEECAVSNQ